MQLLGVAQRYKVRPSQLLGDLDEYTSYCFDEACVLIMSHLDNREEPKFVTHVKTLSSLYAKYE